MSNERQKQNLIATLGTNRPPHRVVEVADVMRREVRQFTALRVAPSLLHRVEFRSIRREPLDANSSGVLLAVPADGGRAVNAPAVPNIDVHVLNGMWGNLLEEKVPPHPLQELLSEMPSGRAGGHFTEVFRKRGPGRNRFFKRVSSPRGSITSMFLNRICLTARPPAGPACAPPTREPRAASRPQAAGMCSSARADEHIQRHPVLGL